MKRSMIKGLVQFISILFFLSYDVLAATPPFITPPSIAGGEYHSIALKNDGTVWTWGGNNLGQLGDGTTINRLTPAQVTGFTNVTAIAGGWSHSIALKNDGTVWTWGYNYYGQLGDGTTKNSLIPVQVIGLTDVKAIAGGGYHSIALKNDGTVWTWGGNNYGQIGDGTSANRLTPVKVYVLTNVTAIAGGGYSTIALKNDKTVWTWGYNNFGQLGDGTVYNRLTPVQVSGLTNITAIAGGGSHSIAIKNDGTVWAWGSNSYHQLGDGTDVYYSLTPVKVSQTSGLTNVTAISAGEYHTAAIKNDGTVWAWGYNYYGQIGDETSTDAKIPVQISGLNNVTAIAGGGYHTLAFKNNDGTVWAWGDNSYYQLGDGIGINSLNPVQIQIQSLDKFIDIAAGGVHSAALKDNKTVWTWGDNSCGQLGNGDVKKIDSSTPVQIPSGPIDVDMIAAGGYHTAALKSGGVWTWGGNYSGQLGDGTTTNRLTPVQVSGLTNVAAIAAGEYHTIALKNGEVWAWGGNDYGQLGDNTTINRLSPVQVGITNVIAISGGEYHTIALKNDGTVWTWGKFGTTNSLIPVQVFGFTDVVSYIAGGWSHNIAIKNGGTVWTWGENYSGQLGDGTTTNRSTPVRVSGLTNITAIAGGGTYGLAVKNNDTVWTWGSNDYGQLGDGTKITRLAPVQVMVQGIGLSDVKKIAGGWAHSIALKNDGTMMSWGLNNHGQLGDGKVLHNPKQVLGQNAQGYLNLGLNGSLTITISPSQQTEPSLAGAHWQVDSDGTWRNSDDTASNLSIGTHTVTFNDIAGWIKPTAPTSVTIQNGLTTNSTGTYIKQTGSLKVTISPQKAIDPGGAKWRVDGGSWQNNDATVSGLWVVGTHMVEFLDILQGWIVPTNNGVGVSVQYGQTTNFTGIYTTKTGNLIVTITPSEVNLPAGAAAKWRVDDGTGTSVWSVWKNSGEMVTGLSAADINTHKIEFQDVPGWAKPADQNVTILNNGNNTTAAGIYIKQLGSLTVAIAPSTLTGARWQVDGGTLQISGATVYNLSVAGNPHTVTFTNITGWTKPSDTAVTIQNTQNTALTGTYIQQFGSLEVIISPSGIGKWRVDGGDWKNGTSSEVVSNLSVAGTHTVEFIDVYGWTKPSNITGVTVPNAGTTVLTTPCTYTQQFGSIKVIISPQGAITTGAQWRIVGDAAWLASGSTKTSVSVPYPPTIEFKDNIFGWTKPANITPVIQYNSTITVTGTYIQQIGELKVAILPQSAIYLGARWRVDNGAWQSSGTIVSNLLAGNHTICFKDIVGWITPNCQFIVIQDGQTLNAAGSYIQQTGELSVMILPQEAVTAGAQWRVDNGAWQNSGDVAAGLLEGSHIIYFKDMSGIGWIKPNDMSINIQSGNTTTVQITYIKQKLIDFNGDWKSDILWHHKVDGRVAIWLMNGTAIQSYDITGTVDDLNWEITKVGDFNGDGKSDILWHHKADGRVAIWLMNGTAIQFYDIAGAVEDLNWEIINVGDFNADGKTDLLWRHKTNGKVAIWLMNGTVIQSYDIIGAVEDLNWEIINVGDFNGDGKSDILWRHKVNGKVAIWLINGTAIQSYDITGTVDDLNWEIINVGDFNGDGKSDILWRHKVNGKVAIWLINGTAIQSYDITGTVDDLNWEIANIGDFNGDGKSDILWRHKVNGKVAIWLMNGTVIQSYDITVSFDDLNWEIINIGDFNGDGKSDILWRHGVNGNVAIWLMNGTTIQSYDIPAAVDDSNWEIRQ